MKKIVFFLIFTIFAFAADIKPLSSVKFNFGILDMKVGKDKLYVATDNGEVLVLDLEGLKVLNEIKIRKIKDFMGELHESDIYTVDELNGKILFLAQAEEGYSELFVSENNSTVKVLDKSASLYAKAAKFVDDNRAILVLMSDEVVLYDIKNKKILKRGVAGEYFYSMMDISPNRKFIVVGDEGGEVIVVDTDTLKRIKLFKDINKDKIISIATTDNMTSAGSRGDKMLAVYDLKSGDSKTKKCNFFVYVTALSPDNSLVVYGDNEKYILKVADISTFDTKYRLVGHKYIVNVIKFIDKNTLVSGSENGEIIKWRLK